MILRDDFFTVSASGFRLRIQTQDSFGLIQCHYRLYSLRAWLGGAAGNQIVVCNELQPAAVQPSDFRENLVWQAHGDKNEDFALFTLWHGLSPSPPLTGTVRRWFGDSRPP